MRQRILLLSWTVPPTSGGSGVIVANLAKQFGRDEMIVTGQRSFGQPGMVWRDEWPRITHSTLGWPQTLRGARWWRWLQLPWLVLRCCWLVRRYKCTAILVVFPSEEFLLAGYLAAACTGTKLFPYFHNTYVEHDVYADNTAWQLRFARWLQGRVFTRASHVFVMSEGMLELYRERYPGLNCSVLPHSFNEALPDFRPAPEPGPILRFVICGNVNESCEEATVRVCQAIARVERASLTFLSGTPSRFLKQLGVLRDGVRHETVSPDHVVGRLLDADVVVLAHGLRGPLSPEEYRTIFPTKTIEYLICGRPILAHAPADCYLARFLTEHGCALLVTEPSVSALLQAVAQLREDDALRARLVRNALRAARMFEARHVAELLRSHLGMVLFPMVRPPMAQYEVARQRSSVVDAEGPKPC
jgi:glycosyltransferase involved in cell wall biosynthesis